MNRFWWLGGLLLLSGCLRMPDRLQRDEVELVIWYVEDLAHGRPREPAELVRHDSSPGLARILEWAAPLYREGRPVGHPPVLLERRNRWPLLREALASRRLKPDGRGGLVPVAAAAKGSADELLATEAERENLDRERITAILLARAGLDPRHGTGRRLASGLVAAAAELDAAAIPEGIPRP